MRAIEKTDIDIPWIIAKGNHDITGPGAVEAFNDIYIPAFRKFTNNPEIKTANYGTTINNIFFACFDPWEKRENSLDILEKNLSSSKAKYKFVLLHEPVIPVNERCWHVYRKKPDNRNRLLKIIAENNAIILCAHLHHYSIVKRNTEWGPIVQILTNSVTRNRKHLLLKKYIQNMDLYWLKKNRTGSPILWKTGSNGWMRKRHTFLISNKWISPAMEFFL